MPAMDVRPVGTRLAMPCSTKALVVTTKCWTYPRIPRRR